MKDPARFIISLIFLSPVLAVSVVTFRGVSHAESIEPQQSTVQQGSTTVSDTNQDKEKRLTDRKTKYKNKFTQFQLSRVKARCQAAQSNLSKVDSRMDKIEKARTQRYAALLQRLNRVSEAYDEESAELTAYNQAVTELKQKITAFETTLASYTQSLGDIASMKCRDDVEGFRATLETARDGRKALVAQSADIRAYLKDSIKPLIQKLRQSEAKKTEVAS